MKTIAIIVGISSYRDEKFEPLPGAKADAERFSAALISWGFPEEWIFMLLDEKATRSGLIKTFSDCRAHFDADAKFIFYFAGHGIRENDLVQGIHESSLVLHNTHADDTLSSGIRMIELMQLIRSLRPLETYIFIDACHLRINQLDNPLSEELLSTSKSRGFFCLLSSGLKSSYEDVRVNGGYFTAALLKAIGELRSKNHPRCQDIFDRVQETLAKDELPPPEIYHISSETMWPIEPHYEKEESISRGAIDLVSRHESLAELQDHLVMHSSPVIWMWGEAGLGKTTLAKQLRGKQEHSIYLSVSPPEMLIDQIREQKSDLFFNRPAEKSLKLTLEHIYKSHPYTIVIFDHIDRLSAIDLEALLSEIDETLLPTILISRYPCPKEAFPKRKGELCDWRAPSLGDSEVDRLLEQYRVSPLYKHVLLGATSGNALKMRQMLARLSEDGLSWEEMRSEKFQRCITAIAATGGFIDEELFCFTFKIKSDVPSLLEKLGLIYYSKKGAMPHDLLLEMVEENKWSIDIALACHYWADQIKRTPYNVWACSSLVILASQHHDCTPFKSALETCLQTLDDRAYLSFLIDLTEIFKRHRWYNKLILACQCVMMHESYHLSEEVIEMLMQAPDPRLKMEAEKINIQRLIWLGQYREVVRCSLELLSRASSRSVIASVRNHLGIAYFFLGKLDEAMRLFQKNFEAKDHLEERERGLTKYMIGHMMTYRGEDLAKAKKLILDSILIFESTKYYHWLIIALTALADHDYDKGHWRRALQNLDRASDLAQAIQHKMLLLFPLRSIVRVSLRLHGQDSELVYTAARNLETTLYENLTRGHNVITFWAQNTLATIYAYRRDRQKVQQLMDELVPLTQDFHQCNIYTLANLGHLAYLSGDPLQAKAHYEAAYTLAKSLNNTLFLREVKEDAALINGSRTSK